MITDLLMEHAWMAPTAFVVLVVVGPLAARWLLGRPRLARVALACSLVPVAVTTLVPVSRRAFEFCAVQWAWPTPTRVELLANVVLFIAPTMVLAVLVRRPLVSLLAMVALSAAIELLQAVVPQLGRSCDTGDWANNALGALIGAGLGALALWYDRAAGDRRGGSGGMPRRPAQNSGIAGAEG